MSADKPRQAPPSGRVPGDRSTCACGGAPPAVVAPVEAFAEESAGAAQTPAETIRAFYARAVARPAVRELLSRLAKE